MAPEGSMNSIAARKGPKRPALRASGDDNVRERTSFKRQRTALACNSCRARKSRCNGSRPKCTMCIEMGLECAYQLPAIAPEKGSEQPSTQLEGRLNSIEETLQRLLEENRRLSDSQGLLSTPFERASQSTVHVGLETNLSGAHEIVDNDYQGQIPPEDTVDGMGTTTFADEQESGFFGPSSNIAFIGQLTSCLTTAVPDATGQGLSRDSILQGGLTSLSRPASPIGNSIQQQYEMVQAADMLALPPDTEVLHLIQLFFSDTGMLFPYIHKDSVLNTFAEARESNFASVRRSWLCLLNMILAFATCVSARPDLPVEQNAAASEVFCRRAQALAGNFAFKPANIEIVQYLLLMTQYLQGTQKSAQTWNLHGLTVKAAFQLGLHTDTVSSRFTMLEREIRKRTWFGCVVLDRTLSMTFGRPPSIPPEFVNMELPLDIDLGSLGERNSPSNLAGNTSTVAFFTATIQLYRILGSVIGCLYGHNIGFSSRPSLASTLIESIRLEKELQDWKSNLPPQLKPHSWDVTVSYVEEDMIFNRLSVIITLRYLNVRVLLHRQILAIFLNLPNDNATDLTDKEFLIQFGAGSLQACLESASQIISIIHSAGKRSNMLGAWWFSTYYTFNAALIVVSGLRIHSSFASHSAGRMLPILSYDSLSEALNLADEALENLGGGVRLVERCRKYLQALIRIATSSGALASTTWPNMPQPQLVRDLPTTEFPGLLSSTDAELSPLGLDLGEFLTEGNLEFITEFMGNSQSGVEAA